MITRMSSPTWPSIPAGEAARPPSIELGQWLRDGSDYGSICRHQQGGALWRSTGLHECHQHVGSSWSRQRRQQVEKSPFHHWPRVK